MQRWKKHAPRLALAAAIILVAGCATRTETVFVQEPLPIPDRPSVPTIQPDDLQCLSDDAYESLVVRDTMLQEHVRRLEAIIKTTHDTEL